MGNSVGFYAVSRDLGSSRVLNPHGSDLNLLTDPGGGSSNVQRLSVTCLDIDGEVSRLSYLEENEGSETSSTVPTKSIASYGSRLSVHSCPESSQDVRVEQVKNVVPENKSISADTFRPPNLETWRDIDSDASSQPNTEPAQDVGEEKVHTEFSRLTSMSHYLEISPDIPSLKDASVKQTALDRYAHNSKRHDHYIPLQSTKVIESLLLELQEGDPTLLSPVGSMVTPLREDPERERPIIYTATNAADWRLGTILEESGSSQKQPCSPEAKSTENIDKYNSSDDDDGMTIGSAVNVTDIEAEREKEEGIQLCLEPYEDKIERIEEYLNSSDSHSSTIDKKAGVEAEMGHSRRQSSVDVSAVIGGNHNITYLHFGSGLEDDVTKVVSSEYSQGVSCTTSTPAFGEDSLVSEIHLFIDDYNPSIKDSPVPHAKTQPVPCERSQSNKKSLGVPKETRAEGVSKVSEPEEEEQYQEALEVNEVTESWGQRLVPPLSAGSQNGVSAGKTDHSESSSNQLAEEMSQLRVDNEKLLTRNRSLQREVEELRRVKTIMEEDVQLKPQINQMTMELTHAKEALSALKADRKRLKAEKFDLLNQMKQLYATLEDKEKELRDFIRNYEQRMKESDESLRQLAAERDETEREKWNILKHARDESERVVKLSAELGAKESTIRKLQEELDAVRKQLISMGYHSDAESVRTNGLPTPTASTPACSPLPLSTPTPTPNGRGSSADSGVRLSSDRDSTASHEGTPTITVERGSLDCDTLSICSSATAASHYYYACGPGTPKESPSLSPLYATPVSLRGEDREDRGGDNTPTSVPTHSAASLNSSAMSGLASSNASTGGLSRSAEQLCERLAEAAESSKIRGCSTLTRKGHKGGGTWGSISRVFARQKKRAALDASLYDGSP